MNVVEMHGAASGSFPRNKICGHKIKVVAMTWISIPRILYTCIQMKWPINGFVEW